MLSSAYTQNLNNIWKVLPVQHLIKVFIPACIVFVVTIFSIFLSSSSNIIYSKEQISFRFIEGNTLYGKLPSEEKAMNITRLDSFDEGQVLGTDASTIAQITFASFGSILLNKNTEIEIVEKNNESFEINLKKGALGLNTIFVDQQLIVNSNNAKYFVDKSILYVDKSSENETALLIEHPVFVSITNKENQYLIMNDLTEARFTRSSKIETRKIDLDENTDLFLKGFITENKAIEKSYLTNQKEYLSNLDSGIVGFMKYKGIGVRKSLSFLPYSQSLYINDSLDYLLGNAYQNNNTQDLQDFITNNFELNYLIEDKLNEYKKLFFASLPSDKDYNLKTFILNTVLSFNQGDPKYILYSFERENIRLFDALDLISKGDNNLAKKTLSDYANEMNNILASTNVAPDAEYINAIVFHKQVLSEIFNENTGFYDENLLNLYMSLSNRIAEIFVNTENDAYYNEDIMNNNLRILNTIVLFIKEELINPKLVLSFYNKLLKSSSIFIDDPDFGYDETNILHKYYSDKISELENIYDFLNSSSVSLKEKTFDEAYAEYLIQEKDLTELQKYLNALDNTSSKTPVKKVNIATVIDSIYKEFKSYGLEINGLKSLDDKDSRLFSFEQSVYKGVPFYGSYDTSTKVVYDLFIDGEKMSSGISLKDLPDLILAIRFGTASEETPDTNNNAEEDSPSKSTTELAVIEIVKDDFDFEGFEIDDSDISSIDLNAGTVKVKQALYEYNEEEITVDFDYNVTSKEASNIKYKVSASEKTISGKVLNTDLLDKIADDMSSHDSAEQATTKVKPKVKK